MNFPEFGDAETNNLIGKACATLIENGASVFSCSDRDPLGKLAYVSLPYLFSKDPVVIDHITLGLKILVFMLFAVTAVRILKLVIAMSGGSEPTSIQSGVSVALIAILLLAICINNIPVRLADMEAACCAMIAVYFALRALQEITYNDKIPDWFIFLTCFFACLGCMFKQSFLVREFLMILAFALCIRLTMVLRLAKDWRVYATILVANFGIGLQLLYVWKHFGVFGLTQPSVWGEVAFARKYPFVAMELFSIPEIKAYMVIVPPGTSRISWIIYKIYYAVATTDPFVYGGYVKPFGHLIPSTWSHWAKVYVTVIAFFAATAASIRYGSRAVRFLTLVAFFNIIFMIGYQHVEPRYHILPKALLVVLAAYWMLRAWNALPFMRRQRQMETRDQMGPGNIGTPVLHPSPVAPPAS